MNKSKIAIQLHITSLAQMPAMLRAVVSGLTETQLKYRPDHDHWSIAAILCHLADEEAEDFRVRTRMTLETPEKSWPAIDPVAAAKERDYEMQSAQSALSYFEKERAESLEWLRSLPPDTNWDAAFVHPKFGPHSAAMLLGAWAAHDLLHLRQIIKRRYQMIEQVAEPHSTLYAGEW